MSCLRMPTSRTLLLLLALVVGGCGAGSGDDGLGQTEGELGATAAGIAAGSHEAEGVVLLVNDRAVTASVLETRTGLDANVAEAIVAFRTASDGSPRWFSSIDEVDALPSTNEAVFRRLVDDARAQGYVEAPGFDPPTSARLSVPDDLGRPPTSADVTVEAGFDGKSPDEVLALVRGRLTNTVDTSNERFVAQTIRDTHKAFTIAVGNLFASGSPPAAFVRSLGADKLVMLGTMSALHPTIIVAEKAGVTSYYARGASGGYEPIAPPHYPIIMRCGVALEPQGVRVFYPPWSAKVLSGPTTVIIEPG
jgi:hypothetical protein